MYNNWSTSRGSKLRKKTTHSSSWVSDEIFYLLNINTIVNDRMKDVIPPKLEVTTDSTFSTKWITN